MGLVIGAELGDLLLDEVLGPVRVFDIRTVEAPMNVSWPSYCLLKAGMSLDVMQPCHTLMPMSIIVGTKVAQ